MILQILLSSQKSFKESNYIDIEEQEGWTKGMDLDLEDCMGAIQKSMKEDQNQTAATWKPKIQ